MKLTRTEREAVRVKFDGRCAYCGELLGARWHADHIEAVERKLEWAERADGKGRTLRSTGEFHRPERHTLENLNPACPPCNIDKHSMSLEEWRKKLSRAVDVLTRNNPTYRHAKRFGLIAETGSPISFYFEQRRSA